VYGIVSIRLKFVCGGEVCFLFRGWRAGGDEAVV
jgi:hypothetical protein